MNPSQSEAMPLKLNYRRTFLIGFAFFGILLLWQVYDSWCPTFLTDIFARRMYDLSSAALLASGEAEKWKALALTKKESLTIHIPRRQFMGPSEALDARISAYVEKEVLRILNQ